MYTRFLASLMAAAVGVVSIYAQQQPASIAPLGGKARINDVPTPGRLAGIRTQPLPRISVNAAGRNLALPQTWQVDPATGAQFRAGQLLVRFNEGVTAARRLQTLQAGRGRRIARALPGNWNLVELEAGTAAADSLRTLRGRSEVAQVTLNYRLRPHQVRPNDEFHNLQWNFDAIGMPGAWEINPGARNDVTVAVIDTGLNTVTDTIVFSSPLVGQIPVRFAQVPDLVTDDRIVSPFDFIYGDDLPVDLAGHGTHVAGTIAQLTNNNIGVAGIAYNVKIMPLKVISGGDFIFSWDTIFAPGNDGGSVAIVADAIRHAADNGAKVINLSLGGPGEAPPLLDAIEYAVSRGAFVAIAAGNGGQDGNPVDYPASYAAQVNGAMAVGAVNRNLRHASYSSFHPYVEICAPGGEMTNDFDFERGVTQIGYEEESTLSYLDVFEKLAALEAGFRPRFDRFEPRPFNGTSMATPHVAGVAALLYSQGITSPAAIEEAIKRFARPIDATAEQCGAGLVDSRRALRGLGLAR